MKKIIAGLFFCCIGLSIFPARAIEPPDGLSEEYKQLFIFENLTPAYKKIWLEDVKHLQLMSEKFHLYSIYMNCLSDNDHHQMLIPEYREALAETAGLGFPLKLMPKDKLEAFNLMFVPSHWAFEQLSENEKSQILLFGNSNVDRKALSVLAVLNAANEMAEISVGVDGGWRSYPLIKFKELVEAEQLSDEFQKALGEQKPDALIEYIKIKKLADYSANDPPKFNALIIEIAELDSQVLRKQLSSEVNERIDDFSEHRFWVLKDTARDESLRILMSLDYLNSNIELGPLIFPNQPTSLSNEQIKSLKEKLKPMIEVQPKMFKVSYGDWLGDKAKKYCQERIKS
ncbi:hypothetical protein GCM10009007_04450 [Formosimonas limnophila]|uniref:Uncharacterized protein n=1 Tax=Formosimonas limnophila TaxID=1384487 RepID=A0A8J3CG45_9BURK|nr:hypothetical protein [Formosimonas limnophila]GHA67003.1 hypothetical protein GCM10009007_04450 [Formosimonas limnophila]